MGEVIFNENGSVHLSCVLWMGIAYRALRRLEDPFRSKCKVTPARREGGVQQATFIAEFDQRIAPRNPDLAKRSTLYPIT